MFDFFRKRRERAERKAALAELGSSLGDDLNAQVALFIEMQIVPKKEAFIDVLKTQLADIDDRLSEFEPSERVSREEAACLDLQMMIENWAERREAKLNDARDWLAEEYELADAAGIGDHFQSLVERSISEQDRDLVRLGIDAVAEAVGEDAVTNARQAFGMQF